MIFEKQLEGVSSVAIAGHVRPDGDCVGSCLAIYNYIKTYHEGVEVDVYLEPIPTIFNFLAGAKKIRQANPKEEKSVDLFIALDCGDIRRLGDAGEYFKQAKRTFCIDHHFSNETFADENYVRPDASSTCELIGEVIDHDKITKEIAECLYTGIVTDTGVFQYSCTHSSTMNFAGELMDMGIDYPYIVEHTFYEKTFEQNRIMGLALLRSKQFLGGRIVASYLTLDEMDEHHVLPKHMEGIVEQIRNTRDTEVALFLHENRDGTMKGSLRATGDTNVAEIAMKYGGGGHAKAAGFTVTGDPEEMIEKIVADLAEVMKG